MSQRTYNTQASYVIITEPSSNVVSVIENVLLKDAMASCSKRHVSALQTAIHISTVTPKIPIHVCLQSKLVQCVTPMICVIWEQGVSLIQALHLLAPVLITIHSPQHLVSDND